MKNFWIWVLVVWSFLFSLCGAIWSLFNTRAINKLEQSEPKVVATKGEFKWQTLLD